MYTVYKHTTPSGKVYVGITKQKPEQRWDNGNGYKKNEHFPTCAVGRQKHLVDTIGNMLKSRGDYDEQVQH